MGLELVDGLIVIDVLVLSLSISEALVIIVYWVLPLGETDQLGSTSILS